MNFILKMMYRFNYFRKLHRILSTWKVWDSLCHFEYLYCFTSVIAYNKVYDEERASPYFPSGRYYCYEQAFEHAIQIFPSKNLWSNTRQDLFIIKTLKENDVRITKISRTELHSKTLIEMEAFNIITTNERREIDESLTSSFSAIGSYNSLSEAAKIRVDRVVKMIHNIGETP